MTLVEHLVEVRDRLIKCLAFVIVFVLALLPFQNKLYLLLAAPMMSHLPSGTTMIATGVVSPFLTPLKLVIYCALILSVPAILYHLWAFVAPGLYRSERRLIFPLLLTSSLLFYIGMAFAYFVVFPIVFDFLSGQTPEGIKHTPDISEYLGLVMKLFFAFGLAFEVPVATVIVVWAGLSTPQELAKKRPYIIVGAFVVGMLLTPPDAISQTLLALPMWLLFEIGLIWSRWYIRDPVEKADIST
ncbi:MAG: twin-arginine translocase subunit TatC [Gammaproteobacteria bacterium]|nr:twin-arginine translocase subunit TatC [Gammaproteobacteria bacterium]